MNVDRPKIVPTGVLIAAVAAAGVCFAQQAPPDAFETKLLSVPADYDRVELQWVLGDIEGRARGLVLFGIEIPLDHGNQPLVSAHIPATVTVREALKIVFEKLPGYTFTSVAPHLITILPEGYTADPGDMLNLPVPSVDIVNVSPSTILNDMPHYIPALHAELFKGQGCFGVSITVSDSAPGITVTAHDTTLLGVLNLVSLESVAAAGDHRGFAWGWAYLRERVAAPSHTWRPFGRWIQGRGRTW